MTVIDLFVYSFIFSEQYFWLVANFVIYRHSHSKHCFSSYFFIIYIRLICETSSLS